MSGKIKEIPVIRAFAYETAPYHVGTVFENRLGSQVVRTLSKHLSRMVRQRLMRRSSVISEKARPLVEALERDGIVVVENFLLESEFDAVTREFEDANQDKKMSPYKGDPNARLWRTQIFLSPDSARQFPHIVENFQQSDLLNEVAGTVIGRRVHERPHIYLDTYENLNDDGFENDIEIVLHADLHTATMKMFYYLNDVDESNGAFVYVKGSHKLTSRRLAHEYDLSIRQAKLKRGMPIRSELLAYRGKEVRNIIDPNRLRAMRAEETHFSVRANSLVIANNMGFHRRGEFSEGRPRKAILVNYRYLERTLL